MKKIFLLSFLFTGLAIQAQWESRIGVTAGVNSYLNKADFLSSKSSPGFSVGIAATVPISDYSEFVVEMTYNRYTMELLGREDYYAKPEWIKFHTNRFNLAVIYDYDILHFLDEDLAIGLNAGPTLSFFNNMKAESDKDYYLLDPYQLNAGYLANDGFALNIYGSAGVSVRYLNLESHLRYNKGLTSPYRDLPRSDYVTLKGKDDFISFSVIYYFGDNF
jgi:hypothetical protein